MVSRIKEVIMMLGKGFVFIGNQCRIVVKDNEYFIDLLFFNRIIRSLFCTVRNSIEVDYAMRDLHKPVGIAEIKLSKILPKDLVGKLPDPHELEQEILHSLEDLDETNKNDGE